MANEIFSAKTGLASGVQALGNATVGVTKTGKYKTYTGRQIAGEDQVSIANITDKYDDRFDDKDVYL